MTEIRLCSTFLSVPVDFVVVYAVLLLPPSQVVTRHEGDGTSLSLSPPFQRRSSVCAPQLAKLHPAPAIVGEAFCGSLQGGGESKNEDGLGFPASPVEAGIQCLSRYHSVGSPQCRMYVPFLLLRCYSARRGSFPTPYNSDEYGNTTSPSLPRNPLLKVSKDALHSQEWHNSSAEEGNLLEAMNLTLDMFENVCRLPRACTFVSLETLYWDLDAFSAYVQKGVRLTMCCACCIETVGCLVSLLFVQDEHSHPLQMTNLWVCHPFVPAAQS